MDGKWMEHAKMCKDSQEHLIRNDGSDAGRRIHPFCCAHSYHTLYIVYCPLPVDIKLSSVPGCLIAVRRSCLSRSLSFDRMQFWAFSWAVSIALNQTLQDVLVQSLQLSPFAHVAKTNIRTASSTRNRTQQQRSQSTSFDQIYAAMKGNAWGKAGDQNWSTAIIYYVKTCEKWKGIVLCGAVSTFIWAAFCPEEGSTKDTRSHGLDPLKGSSCNNFDWCIYCHDIIIYYHLLFQYISMTCHCGYQGSQTREAQCHRIWPWSPCQCHPVAPSTTEVQRWRPWSMGRWQRWACGMEWHGYGSRQAVKFWNPMISIVSVWFCMYIWNYNLKIISFPLKICSNSARQGQWKGRQGLWERRQRSQGRGYNSLNAPTSALQEWTPQTAWNLILWTDELRWTVWLSRHAIIHSVGYEQVLSITFSCNAIMCICK